MKDSRPVPFQSSARGRFRRPLDESDVAWCKKQDGKQGRHLSSRKRARLDKLLRIYQRENVVFAQDKSASLTERAVASAIAAGEGGGPF